MQCCGTTFTDTHLKQQPCLHWGLHHHQLPHHHHHLLLLLLLLHLHLLLPPAAWRTVAAGPSSVALCGPVGSGIEVAPLAACSAAAAAGLRPRRSQGAQGHRQRRGAVRWPPPGAWHCWRPGPGRWRCQDSGQLGRARPRGWIQGWGRQSCSGRPEAATTPACSRLTLRGSTGELLTSEGISYSRLFTFRF